MTTIAVVQARMGSSRLAGKVLEDLGGIPVLAWVCRAAAVIPGVHKVVVATSRLGGDDAIEAWCTVAGIACYRGSEDDVLSRFADITSQEQPELVVRLTADCPLLDPQVCGQVIALLRLTGADYATNADPRRWPDGTDCEVVRAAALLEADRLAVQPSEREHVTPYVRNRRLRYRVESLACPIPGLGGQRWTLDTADDLAFLRRLVGYLPTTDRPPSFLEALAAAEQAGAIEPITARSGAVVAAVAEATTPSAADNQGPDYARSNALLERAIRTIPLGTQTFSKAYTQMPAGAAPLFLSHGRGARVWDVDGNRYIDLVCGLLPVVLGYCDADVDEAIQRQMNHGISFSLATDLEAELAERLVSIIPCAEKVRFGKNGTDATSAAIRLARAFTGRDRVAICGYHGWQDWYIGATSRDKGVPPAVRALTHPFPFDDLVALERLLVSHRDEFAAVIIEPMTAAEPAPGYLEGLKALTHAHGALLVFDEVITGFRLALGGAQEHFGVAPDLASFGKAMGNGMPIAAVVGRADVMAEMEEVFFSGTFGGETLSLAAAIAVIDKMRREPVIDTLWQKGRRLAEAVDAEIAARQLDDVIRLQGSAPWTLVSIADHPTARAAAIKTLFKREMLATGVLIGGSHNVCYAMDDADHATVVAAYRGTLDTIAEELASGDLEQRLGCPPIEPVFAVR